MKTLYTTEEYLSSKASDLLSLECEYCAIKYFRKKKYITHELKTNKGECRFCSEICFNKNKITKQKVICANCNSEFYKPQSDIKRSKNNFCSRSCAATFNNKNKTTGTRRSKLEIWLENQLPILYPQLEFHFNKKGAIGSELDIYIPSLYLAFELNGIFHYEPIYGKEKLTQTKNNDQNKFKSCGEKNISLCIIDTSQQKYFKESTSKKYLEIITNIIKEHLLTS